MEKKAWYASKTIWAGIIIAATGIASYFGLNVPTELVVTLAGAFGIYGIRDAIDQKWTYIL